MMSRVHIANFPQRHPLHIIPALKIEQLVTVVVILPPPCLQFSLQFSPQFSLQLGEGIQHFHDLALDFKGRDGDFYFSQAFC